MADIFELTPRQFAYRELAQEERARAERSKGGDAAAFVALARLARQLEHLAREADAEAKVEIGARIGDGAARSER